MNLAEKFSFGAHCATLFTTLRDPGAFDLYYGTVALRNAINSGKLVGPRLFVAPHPLSANPLQDIRSLEQVRFVMKGGAVFKAVTPL